MATEIRGRSFIQVQVQTPRNDSWSMSQDATVRGVRLTGTEEGDYLILREMYGDKPQVVKLSWDVPGTMFLSGIRTRLGFVSGEYYFDDPDSVVLSFEVE